MDPRKLLRGKLLKKQYLPRVMEGKNGENDWK